VVASSHLISPTHPEREAERLVQCYTWSRALEGDLSVDCLIGTVLGCLLEEVFCPRPVSIMRELVNAE